MALRGMFVAIAIVIVGVLLTLAVLILVFVLVHRFLLFWEVNSINSRTPLKKTMRRPLCFGFRDYDFESRVEPALIQDSRARRSCSMSNGFIRCATCVGVPPASR